MGDMEYVVFGLVGLLGSLVVAFMYIVAGRRLKAVAPRWISVVMLVMGLTMIVSVFITAGWYVMFLDGDLLGDDFEGYRLIIRGLSVVHGVLGIMFGMALVVLGRHVQELRAELDAYQEDDR